MDVSDFDFVLPDELVAQEAAPRGESRLLVLDRARTALRHAAIADLPSVLAPGDLLVVNNTRVFAARLLGRRVPSGGAVECFLLGPGAQSPGGEDRGDRDPGTPNGPAPSLPSPASLTAGTRQLDPRTGNFDALMHPGQKLKPGARVRFEGDAGVLLGEVVGRGSYGRRTIRLWTEDDAPVEARVDALGHMPLPPYIRRPDTLADRDRYQTVYASVRGSIAAPTAGLHFTPEILAALDRRGIQRAEITLHVGYGTFKPIRVSRVEDHRVDPEAYDISAEAAGAIARAKREGRNVIAVGTTTTRALEDAAIRGGGQVLPGAALATAFLYPGHAFQVIDGLLTNFHLPASSLLMLVAAFAGRERVLAAYAEAVSRRYRFYSYGDAMLLL